MKYKIPLPLLYIHLTLMMFTVLITFMVNYESVSDHRKYENIFKSNKKVNGNSNEKKDFRSSEILKNHFRKIERVKSIETWEDVEKIIIPEITNDIVKKMMALKERKINGPVRSRTREEASQHMNKILPRMVRNMIFDVISGNPIKTENPKTFEDLKNKLCSILKAAARNAFKNKIVEYFKPLLDTFNFLKDVSIVGVNFAARSVSDFYRNIYNSFMEEEEDV